MRDQYQNDRKRLMKSNLITCSLLILFLSAGCCVAQEAVKQNTQPAVGGSSSSVVASDPAAQFRGLAYRRRDLTERYGVPGDYQTRKLRYPGGWEVGGGIHLVEYDAEPFLFIGFAHKNGVRLMLVEEQVQASSHPDSIIRVRNAMVLPPIAKDEHILDCRHPQYFPSKQYAVIGVARFGDQLIGRKARSPLWKGLNCAIESTSVRLAWIVDVKTGEIRSIDPKGTVCVSISTMCNE